MDLPLLKKLLPGGEPVLCRYCGSADVRPSHKVGSGTHHVIYRCRACKQHFKVVTKPRLSLPAGLGIGLFALLALGVTAAFFMNANRPDGTYQTKGADTDDRAALARMEHAAQGGNVQAQYDLGRTHALHDDYRAAFPLIKAAAEHGHTEAQYELGRLYLNGQGTVQNYRTALEQFTLAAEHGHLEAQYQLGIFHRDGLATPPSKETAYVWFNVAAARGHADALVLRDKLMLSMTGEEIGRAQEASARLHQRFSDPASTPRK